MDASGTELIGVGSVFGNCTEQKAASNALVVLAAAGWVDIPVCVVGHGPDRRRRRAHPTAPTGLAIEASGAGWGVAVREVGGRADPANRSCTARAGESVAPGPAVQRRRRS
ncbi:hypothetical protein P3H15_38370 [Rhodococcus sp. T2V]|nr:hypothetical protein [Rhodococcus sp. T2V]MDF3310877.1 hypothetical protein [Rhodococcus sp. T2V]